MQEHLWDIYCMTKHVRAPTVFQMCMEYLLCTRTFTGYLLYAKTCMGYLLYASPWAWGRATKIHRSYDQERPRTMLQRSKQKRDSGARQGKEERPSIESDLFASSFLPSSFPRVMTPNTPSPTVPDPLMVHPFMSPHLNSPSSGQLPWTRSMPRPFSDTQYPL